MKPLQLNGCDLTLESFAEVVLHNRTVALADDARERVVAARKVVDTLVAGDGVAYAITTGVGHLADVRISHEQARELQINLVRSHAVGVGDPLREEESRAMMLLRANSLAKGLSGVRPVVLDTLCLMLNRGVHPVIPLARVGGCQWRFGSAGAPGAGAGGRRRGHLQGQAFVGRRGHAGGGDRVHSPGGQGGHQPD